MMLSQLRHGALILGAVVITYIFYINDGISHSRRIIFQIQSLTGALYSPASDAKQIHGTNGPVQHHDTAITQIQPEMIYPTTRPLYDSAIVGSPANFGGKGNFPSYNSKGVAELKLHTESDFDGLANLCNETEWVEGLWLHCHSRCGANHTSICGGLNNARNRVQTCLRLAIDAGMGLIMPSVTMRDEANLVDTGGSTTVCADQLWDIVHLQKALGEQCPQLKIRRCDDRSGIDTVVNAPERAYLDGSYTNGTFRRFIEKSFQNSDVNFTDVMISNQVAVSFGDSYIGWNYRYSFELSTIRKALFKVLKFNQYLLELSSKVLQSPELQGAFIGVHLRGENDWPAGFGGVHDQMRLYVEEIEKIQTTSSSPIKTVYVSCGDPTAIGWFRDKLSPLGYSVHDKWTILANQPDTLIQVEALAFDQKAIVEYHNLVEAKYWMGLITSSMSSLIAYARSVDEEDDYFETYIFPNSSKNGFERRYLDSPAMKGNDVTKLMVVSGPDIMESFP